MYVRQRLAELGARMPPRMGTRERAELAFLEEKVVHDHMPMRRRRLRDPLRDVDEREIKQTNLVSYHASLEPSRLTLAVSPCGLTGTAYERGASGPSLRCVV